MNEVGRNDGTLGAVVGDLVAYVTESRPFDVIPTGLAELDAVIGGGLRRRQLTALAGPPGVGTSTLALTIAREAAIRSRVPTLFIAPDAEHHELITRVVAAETKVPVNHLRAGDLNDADISKLGRIQPDVEQATLIFSANWLRPKQPLDGALEDYATSVNLGLVVVDFPPDSRRVVRALKIAAQQHNTAVVVCIKTPIHCGDPLDAGPTMLEAARAATGLDELADLIIGLHRPDAYVKDSLRPGEADISVLKHRYGPTRRLAPIAFPGPLRPIRRHHLASLIDDQPRQRPSTAHRCITTRPMRTGAGESDLGAHSAIPAHSGGGSTGIRYRTGLDGSRPH